MSRRNKQKKTKTLEEHKARMIHKIISEPKNGTTNPKGLRPPGLKQFQSRSVRPNNLPSTPTDEEYVPQLGVDFDEEGRRF